METRNLSHGQGISFTHLKGALSPAEVVSSPATNNDSCTPRRQPNGPSQPDQQGDYFSLQIDHTAPSNPHHRLSMVSEILHKTMDGSSPPISPMATMGSTYSSTDSLASLVERQQQNKIIHPSHETQLFKCPLVHGHSRVAGRQPSVLNPFPSRSGSNSHATRPTRSSLPNPNLGTRQMHPAQVNPYHVHSSPAVKESTKVSLGYDPVSRKKVLNSYEIVKELGKGEHGKVKLAKNLLTGELVAIKIIDRKSPKRAFRQHDTHEEKVRREIAIMKKINHPNVVQLKEVMDDENSRKIYLVLEYLERGEVKWQRAPGVPLMSISESMKVFRDVVLGLEYLHYQGIVHRDIKPANLLIAGNGAVKISDFGVSFASSLKTGEQDDYDLAKSAGTPAFLAPELCGFSMDDKQHPKINYKIDIWALGVTLYCFLFGKLPFWAKNEFELFDVICHEELDIPEQFPDHFTPQDKGNVRNFLPKILDKDPSSRLTIREIKQHPLTLRDLTLEEATIFIEGQKSCEKKIKVSNEEVNVAVTGLGSKLKRGFAKALKFAGFRRPLQIPAQQTHSSGFQGPYVLSEASNSKVSSILLTEGSPPSTNGHRRVKSGDSATLTETTVEGDLFVRNDSALRSLNNIMDVDKRRSSVSSLGVPPMSSNVTSESFNTISTETSMPVGTQLVSLPVNASFASLDSVYMDNYAPSYAYTSTSRERRPSNKDVAQKMQNFTLNKTKKRLEEDNMAPHTVFDFGNGSDSDTESDETTESDGDYGDDQISELSIPSHLIQDMVTPPRQQTNAQRSTTGKSKPKYSFMENSSQSESNSEPEVIFANTSDEDDGEDSSTYVTDLGISRAETIPESIAGGLMHVPDSGGDETDISSSSSADELMISFGSSRKCHSMAVASTARPNNQRPEQLPMGYKESLALRRIASPLIHNAPKTPVSTENAHLASEYANHYHRVMPNISPRSQDSESRARSSSITVGLLNRSHENVNA